MSEQIRKLEFINFSNLRYNELIKFVALEIAIEQDCLKLVDSGLNFIG